MGIRTALLVLVCLSVAAPVLADGLDLDAIHALRDKGKEHFDQAANTELSRKKRNDHLKAAWGPLKEAWDILNKWCDEHPEDIEKLEDLFQEIQYMRFWIRKEAPVGLIEEGENERPPMPDWGPKPDDLDKPALPPGEAPAPKPAAPDEPPAPSADVIERAFKHAEEYEKDHPWDIPGLLEIYLNILDNTVAGSAPYYKAMKKVAHFRGLLKDAYRRIRDEDPGTLKNDGAEVRRFVDDFRKDLKNKNADIRLRAAEYLGMLGSSEGAHNLADALKREKEEAVVEMIFKALLQIGGKKVTEELGKIRKWKNEDLQKRAIAVLAEMVGKSSVDLRYASIQLGTFLFSRYKPIRREALDLLKGLGKDGTLGLMNGLPVKDIPFKKEIIHALGDTGDGRAGAPNGLGGLLMGGVKGELAGVRQAAIDALKKIGTPCVPYLAPCVDHNRNGKWARFVLREITGQWFKTSAHVMTWWRRSGR